MEFEISAEEFLRIDDIELSELLTQVYRLCRGWIHDTG